MSIIEKNRLKIRRIIKTYFLNKNIYIGSTVPVCELTSFLNSIKPVNTNYELIRIGGESDGGYLIPNDLDGINACFSPGVSVTSNFENDLTEKGISCFLADYSVNSPPIENFLFDFEKKFIGVKNDEVYMTLEDWVNRKTNGKNELLLQMDIEGSEYAVLLNTPYSILEKFRIMVIEFHGLDNMITTYGYTLIKNAFDKLINNFEVVHIHPNNYCGVVSYGNLVIPKVMEFTFLKKERITNKSPANKFPHPLDRKNVSNIEDIILPKCWY